MKLLFKSLALSAGLLLCAHGYTQTAAPGAKSAATKATMVVNPLAPGAAATTPAPATVVKPAAAPAVAAAGGGDGKVWVNSKSSVYHCPGTKFYGKTKAGEYMSEADAKAKGNHPNNKKACS